MTCPQPDQPHACDALSIPLAAGSYGWYSVFNTTSSTTYTAPKRLELILFNVPREKWVYWTSCWPAGVCACVRVRVVSHLLSHKAVVKSC